MRKDIKKNTYKVTKKYVVSISSYDFGNLVDENERYLAYIEDFYGASIFCKTKKQALNAIKNACNDVAVKCDMLPEPAIIDIDDFKKFHQYFRPIPATPFKDKKVKIVFEYIKISKRYKKEIKKYLLKKCNRKGFLNKRVSY